MKLLYCERCRMIVVPSPIPFRPMRCQCGESAVWWEQPSLGILKVWSSHPEIGRVSVLGIHSDFLSIDPDGLVVQKKQIDEILADTPSNYLFKNIGSVIVRFKVGASGDVTYATNSEYEERKKAWNMVD